VAGIFGGLGLSSHHDRPGRVEHDLLGHAPEQQRPERRAFTSPEQDAVCIDLFGRTDDLLGGVAVTAHRFHVDTDPAQPLVCDVAAGRLSDRCLLGDVPVVKNVQQVHPDFLGRVGDVPHGVGLGRCSFLARVDRQ
jgi:hypothetical protein